MASNPPLSPESQNLINTTSGWRRNRPSFNLEGHEEEEERVPSFAERHDESGGRLLSGGDPHDADDIEWSSSSEEEGGPLTGLQTAVKSVVHGAMLTTTHLPDTARFTLRQKDKLFSLGKNAAVSGKQELKQGMDETEQGVDEAEEKLKVEVERVRKKSVFQKIGNAFSPKKGDANAEEDEVHPGAPAPGVLPPSVSSPPSSSGVAAAAAQAVEESDDNWRWFTLRDLCSRLIAGVNLGVRRRSNKTFTGAFTGEEAILWILADEKNPARAAPEALQLAQALLDYGFVQRMSAHRQLHDTHLRHTDVSAKKRFKNNATVYRPVKVMVAPWRLHVNIHSCSNLPPKSAIGKAFTGEINPYIKLELGDDEQKTKVVMGSASPTFHEHFSFGLDDPSAAQLRVRANQYETLLEDSYLCSAQLSLYSLPVRDASEGLVDQMRKSPPYLIALRRDPLKLDPSDKATLKISMWLTKHTSPPAAMQKTTITDYVLKAFVYKASNVTNGHLAAVDMKIGSALRIKWHNRVSLGVGQGRPVYTRLVRKGTGTTKEEKERRAESTEWNEVIEMPVRLNVLSDNVRLIVHQKAKHDLNERAVGAITLPARKIPLLDPDSYSSITYPDPHEALSMDIDGTFKDPSKPHPLSPTATGANVLSSSPNLRESLEPMLRAAGNALGIASSAELNMAPEEGSELNEKRLSPKLLQLSTLAAVGQNRLIANGTLKVVMWLEEKATTNLLGEDCDETLAESEDALAPITFPLPLAYVGVDTTVPVGFKRTRRALLAAASPFMEAHFESQGFTDMKLGAWKLFKTDDPEEEEEGAEGSGVAEVDGGEGGKWNEIVGSAEWNGPLPDGCELRRNFTYTMPKSAMVKANPVRQIHTLSGVSKRMFVFTTKTYTPEVPFGSTFRTNVQHLAERRSATQTWLGLSSEAEFLTKRPFVAGQIEGGVKAGTKASLSEMVTLLTDAASGKKIEKGDAAGAAGKQGYGRKLLFLAAAALVLLLGWFGSDIKHAVAGVLAGVGNLARWLLLRLLLSGEEMAVLGGGWGGGGDECRNPGVVEWETGAG
ncbi:hypothetical protein TeGR_g10211 [Tetraparma gracilis]|uniref:C2 domain-containing protein n=1 Tax=Tetraparma gracilis TaxID=2962635 RepID=A0ABQ6M9L9_9STRA|nr:hypothetical protein TeGR_g10211 [Tetraparma gracilis]